MDPFLQGVQEIYKALSISDGSRYMLIEVRKQIHPVYLHERERLIGTQ